MFFHNFKYTLKILFKNKMLIFWTYVFPLILGTFFYLAFSDIENNEKLGIINIAIVNDNSFNRNEVYKEAFKALSDESNTERLFNTKYVSLSEAEDLLENKKIIGYLKLNDVVPEIYVNDNGINETIFKFVTEEIMEVESIMQNVVNYKLQSENIVEEDSLNVFYSRIYKEVMEIYNNDVDSIKNVSSSNLSYTMIEFYTLIAMAALYGAILGMFAVNQNLPNMSSKGKRIGVSPISKGILIFSGAIASYLVQLIGMLLLFFYTIFVLNVDYGSNVYLVILLALLGTLAGTTMGIMIASLFKVNENTKTGIIISVTMFCCFLSGMMGITMKYVIDKNIPILNKINPASMITDGFYSLYYYDTLDRYTFNIVSLMVFSLIMLAVSIFSLRRQNYESV